MAGSLSTLRKSTVLRWWAGLFVAITLAPVAEAAALSHDGQADPNFCDVLTANDAPPSEHPLAVLAESESRSVEREVLDPRAGHTIHRHAQQRLAGGAAARHFHCAMTAAFKAPAPVSPGALGHRFLLALRLGNSDEPDTAQHT